MARSASSNEMLSSKHISSVISLLLVMIAGLEITNAQNFVPTNSIPATQSYFTQQTYPWGFSYSFSEIGKSHNSASSKTAVTNSGYQTANVVIPGPFGIPFSPRLSFIPLPLLRNANESSLVVPTPTIPNPTDNSKDDEKSTVSSIATTATTTTTTSSPPTETTKSVEDKTNLLNSNTDELPVTTPKTGFYFTHLTTPLTFSYGFTTIGHTPLPIPHLPLFGFGYNSTSESTTGNQNDIKKENVETTTTTTAAPTTTSSTTETTEKSSNDDNKESSNREDTTENQKSEAFSESATEKPIEDKEDDDPNLETETISSIKLQNEDPFGKLKDEAEGQLSDDEESPTTITPTSTTTTTTTTEKIVSSTILANIIDDTDSGKTATSKSNIIFRTGNDKSEFYYSVKDETTFDEKSHEEQRNGDVVKGKYSVVGPDGALRTVTYYANEDGFKADVVRKESYTKPFPVFQNSITRAPGAIQSLSHQNVLSYYYNGFQLPPPNPGVLRNFGYGYIVPSNLG